MFELMDWTVRRHHVGPTRQLAIETFSTCYGDQLASI